MRSPSEKERLGIELLAAKVLLTQRGANKARTDQWVSVGRLALETSAAVYTRGASQIGKGAEPAEPANP